MLLCVSQARDPGCSYNAIFAYAAAAIAWVFLHVALNCLKSQEIYSRDWKFSLLRKRSTKWINCFRKHIAGVGFWKLWLVGWLVSWCYSGIRGLHWTMWKCHFWGMEQILEPVWFSGVTRGLVLYYSFILLNQILWLCISYWKQSPGFVPWSYFSS